MIVLALVTQNEEDLLRGNIQHHLNWGFDHIAVADNDSTDGTADVAREFGTAVSYQRFPDFHDRQLVRAAMIAKLKDQGRVDWAAVADTDEMFWAPGASGPRALLAGTPADIVGVNFDMKLFLPTVLDPPDVPVFIGRVYRSSSSASPLHTSYRAGKSFYRGEWLTEILDEHWSANVPHDVYRHDEPAVHHYMIQDEDQFVQKVERLMSWVRPQKLTDRIRWKAKQRRNPDQLPHWIGKSKREWWSVYANHGEAGLREYYRTVYTLGEDRVRNAIAAGELVEDSAFARWAEASSVQ